MDGLKIWQSMNPQEWKSYDFSFVIDVTSDVNLKKPPSLFRNIEGYSSQYHAPEYIEPHSTQFKIGSKLIAWQYCVWAYVITCQ